MRHQLQLVIGLLACLAVASALPGLFPRENITTYRYYADVKTGTMEPAPFASQFVITGFMHITPELSDPNLKNAFYILLNVTHGVRNGKIQHFERILENTLPIPDAAAVLNEPFVVIFDDNGKVKSLMTNKKEAGWSQNMKKSIGSMLQLDLSSMSLETPMKPHGFSSEENTIYGECAVAYDVHHTPDLEENHFTVTKSMDPQSCKTFHPHTFDTIESEKCESDPAENWMTFTSRRVFQIEDIGETLLIKKLVAHGVINYLPWNAQSEAYYILANQTMELESITPTDSMTLPELQLSEMVSLNDVRFKRSESLYGVNAGVDPTYGRHVINLETLITKLIKMLEEAADYMTENNLEMTSPEMKHGQTINRILDTMSRMDLPSIENVFNKILDGTKQKDITIKNMFLAIVPYVGTNATCLFTRNIIRKQKIQDSEAITMMFKLPYNIRDPTESLLIEMEDLMRLGNDTSLVRKAGILCFATMIYKTHRHVSSDRMSPELINRYVQYYYDHVINEPTFGMKMTYLQAMNNIQIGNVHTYLEPIIRGTLKVSERPDHLRLHAMLVNRLQAREFDYIHDLYWPILSNTALPLELRVCAYNILVKQPRMERLMNLYWFMVYEKNEHLYNYHYTTMKGLANSANPCMRVTKEIARKIVRFIRVRPVSHIYTGSWLIDYQNKQFGFGESVTVMSIADEDTGYPYIGVFEMKSLNKRNPGNHRTLYLRYEGENAPELQDLEDSKEAPVDQILNILKRAAEDMTPSEKIKKLHIELSMMIQGRTAFTVYLDSVPESVSMVQTIIELISRESSYQSITFDELHVMQVPNDLGLPSLLQNKVPEVMSLTAGNDVTYQKGPTYNMKVASTFTGWRHGYYSLEAYNPMIDTWHGIRRVSAHDISLPIAMSMSYNEITKSFKLTWPRLPLTQYSISGVRSHVKNYVVVMEAEDGVLEKYCADCRQTELVTEGEEHRKNVTILNLDSIDTGLSYNAYRYDCERFVVRTSHFGTLFSLNQNTWNDSDISSLVNFRELYLHALNNPEPGSCGYIFKMEPSIIHPTSQIDINVRMNVEEPSTKILYLLPARKINFRATLEAKAAATDTPVRTWIMNVNIGNTQGYINNQLQVQLTRKSSGQTDQKICIDASKSYPSVEVDPLIRVPTMKQEVLGKLTFTMGESPNGTCVRDGVSVTIGMKGELSQEQIYDIKRETADSLCDKDIANPNYLYTESSIVPRTPACIRETMLRTDLRKYTYTVLYRNIPYSAMPVVLALSDVLRSTLNYEYEYNPAHTEPGTIKIFAEYLKNNKMNLILRTPSHEERYTAIKQDDHLNEFGFQLDNTRFPQDFVDDLEKKNIKICSVYPEVLLNADGAVMPFTVPHEWTLVTGDWVDGKFSVFIKRLEPKKLGLLMTVNNHTIQVIPSATIPTVTVDDNVIDYVNGVTVPDDIKDYALRTVWNQNRLVIQSPFTSFDLEWTERSVTLAMKDDLEGTVTGLCGHLDGTHTKHVGKVYTFEK